jgi:acyl carrier protein
MQEIESSVTDLIAEKLGINKIEIKEGSLFKDDLGADSLDLYELFHEAEKRFDTTMPDEQAEKILSVGALINFIKIQKE